MSSSLKFPPVPDLESGQIADMTVPMLLVGLKAQGWTGLLTLERPGQVKTLYISKGLPVGIASNLRHEQLGAFLLEEGMISLSDFRESNELVSRKGIKLGEALIQMGRLTSADVYNALHKQARYRILDIFGWTDGHYGFVKNNAFWDQITAVDLPFTEILAEGMRSTYGFRRLAKLFDALERHYFSIEERFVGEGGWSGLEDRELRLLPSINGNRTLIELAALPGIELRTLFPLLAYLALGGWLNCSPAPLSAGTLDLRREAAAKVAPKDMEMRGVIIENYVRVKGYNYYRLLGIPPSATADQVVQAYQKLSAKYDPAKYAQYDLGPMRAKLFEIYAKIETANQTLSNPNMRASYDLFLKRNQEAFDKDRAQSFSAEIEFNRGREFLEKNAVDKACDCLARAADLDPRQPDYHCWLAVALMRREPPHSLEAKSRLALALDIDPHHFLALKEMGLLYLSEGRQELARKSFELADRIRPENPEIASYLHKTSRSA